MDRCHLKCLRKNSAVESFCPVQVGTFLGSCISYTQMLVGILKCLVPNTVIFGEAFPRTNTYHVATIRVTMSFNRSTGTVPFRMAVESS